MSTDPHARIAWGFHLIHPNPSPACVTQRNHRNLPPASIATSAPPSPPKGGVEGGGAALVADPAPFSATQRYPAPPLMLKVAPIRKVPNTTLREQAAECAPIFLAAGMIICTLLAIPA